jgi:hypothetical protein
MIRHPRRLAEPQTEYSKNRSGSNLDATAEIRETVGNPLGGGRERTAASMLPLSLRLTPWPVLILALAGCSREPLPDICDPLQAGQLAISELRGKQTGADTRGQWIEVYNTSGNSLALYGVSVQMQKLDGSGVVQLVIREQHSLAAGEYFVLGRFSNAELPAHVDYGYAEDYDSDLYDEGLLDIVSCGDPIDRVQFHDLPSAGTLGFDGNLELTAINNDMVSDWCIDDIEAPPQDGGTTELGVPGTPGERNRSCD